MLKKVLPYVFMAGVILGSFSVVLYYLFVK